LIDLEEIYLTPASITRCEENDEVGSLIQWQQASVMLCG